MDEVKSHLESNAVDKAKSSLSESTSMLSERQKLILLADKSEFGWKTVEQYTQHELADNEEDGKKRSAVPKNEPKKLSSPLLPKDLSTNLHRSVALPVPRAFLPSIPEVLCHLVPSVTSAIGCPIFVHPTFRQGPVIRDLQIGLRVRDCVRVRVSNFKPVMFPEPLFFMLVLGRESSSWDEMGT